MSDGKFILVPLALALMVVGLIVSINLSANNTIVIPGENGCREEITENNHIFAKDTIDRVIICEKRK